MGVARSSAHVLIVVTLLAACDDHAPPRHDGIRTILVDHLTDADRGELVQLNGTASQIAARDRSRISFQLSHGGRSVPVVVKSVLPETFRDGVEATVTGRWTATSQVRADLDREGFRDLTATDVFLARDVVVAAPSSKNRYS